MVDPIKIVRSALLRSRDFVAIRKNLSTKELEYLEGSLVEIFEFYQGIGPLKPSDLDMLAINADMLVKKSRIGEGELALDIAKTRRLIRERVGYHFDFRPGAWATFRQSVLFSFYIVILHKASSLEEALDLHLRKRKSSTKPKKSRSNTSPVSQGQQRTTRSGASVDSAEDHPRHKRWRPL